jgi:ribosomal protein S18 acetylase RimI-like enzyme
MIVPSSPEDRAAVGRIAAEVGVFDAEEIATVYELFDEYAADPSGSGYYFLTCRDQGRVLGFACYGPTPLTQGTYDLYWICAARAAQRQGVGRALLQRVAAEVRAAGGRLIVISTSGGPGYQAARSFYERSGCALAGVVRDYYKPGDDLCLYSLHVAA